MELQEFCKIFASETNIAECLCVPEASFKELEGWSSLAAVLTIALTDEEFGKDISVDEINNTKTLNDLYELIQSK